jgi:hypothetical protein
VNIQTCTILLDSFVQTKGGHSFDCPAGWVEEEIPYEDDIIFFDGGSYFRGPVYLLPQVETDNAPSDDVWPSDGGPLQDMGGDDPSGGALPVSNVVPLANGVAVLGESHEGCVVSPCIPSCTTWCLLGFCQEFCRPATASVKGGWQPRQCCATHSARV